VGGFGGAERVGFFLVLNSHSGVRFLFRFRTSITS
jgi:hypothetical protein